MGSEGMTLSGRDVLELLEVGKAAGMPFDDAWDRAVNRIQPSQGLGVASLTAGLRDDRTLLEENRHAYQAAYEGRPMTASERAAMIAASWSRTADLGPERPAAGAERPAQKRAA